MDLEQHYQGRRVFITGHTGFKGAWLALWLTRMGAQVTGYSLDPPTSPSLFEALRLGDCLNHIHGDLLDRRGLAAALAASRADIVFHLAAQALVKRSHHEPAETFETNVMGTVNVLEAVRACPHVRAVVNITSDKCYENREWPWGYRENDPMGGADPYSASKGCAELVASAYMRTFFKDDPAVNPEAQVLASARAGNVIGGGDWGQDRIIPDCIRAAGSGQPIRLRNPAAIRPWQFVLEPLRGYLELGAHLLAEGRAFAGGWNFGPREERPVSVEELVRLFLDAWGQGRMELDEAVHAPEAGLLRLDCSLARFRLGFSAALEVREALEATVAWYKRHAEGGDSLALRAFSLEQIAWYEDKCRLQAR